MLATVRFFTIYLDSRAPMRAARSSKTGIVFCLIGATLLFNTNIAIFGFETSFIQRNCVASLSLLSSSI